MKTSTGSKSMPMFKAKPAMNSGIFSHGTKGGKQKMDRAPKMDSGTKAAKALVMSTKGRHPL